MKRGAARAMIRRMSTRKRSRLRTKAALQAIMETTAAHGDVDAQTYLARERARHEPLELKLFVEPPAKKR
jgi:hypothetical protein